MCFCNLFVYVYLENKSNKRTQLDSIIKENKLKHNNLSMNKLLKSMNFFFEKQTHTRKGEEKEF